MKLSPRWLLLIHVLFWMALAAAAYVTAGPYKFASCWQIIPMYFPPLNFLLLAIAGFSLIFLLASIVSPEKRTDPCFSAASHGMILTVGLIGCNLSAYVAAGPVNCL